MKYVSVKHTASSRPRTIQLQLHFIAQCIIFKRNEKVWYHAVAQRLHIEDVMYKERRYYFKQSEEVEILLSKFDADDRDLGLSKNEPQKRYILGKDVLPVALLDAIEEDREALIKQLNTTHPEVGEVLNALAECASK